MSNLSDEELNERLREAAGRAATRVTVRHPGELDTQGANREVVTRMDPDQRRPRRTPWVLAGAAVVIAVVIGVGIVMSGSEEPGLQTPAEPDPGVVDPTTTTSTTTTLVADAAASAELAAAIDNTLSTSWVAKLEMDGRPPEGERKINYEPPSPAEGRIHAAARIVSNEEPDPGDSRSGESGYYADELGRLVPCSSPQMPCDPPSWGRTDLVEYSALDELLPSVDRDVLAGALFAIEVPLLQVNPANAAYTDVPGEFVAGWKPLDAAVTDAWASPHGCAEEGCGQFRVRVSEDSPLGGPVVEYLELRFRDPDGIQGSLDGEDLIMTMAFAEFGSTPELDLPAESDVIDIDPSG